jgi:hypothetical protein
MTYMGKVQDGVIVLDGAVRPTEGAVVRVEEVIGSAKDESIIDSLLELAGTIDAPSDASVNVDHYLYGLPKK